jgi:C-terminal processing protease CtpA/Prc
MTLNQEDVVEASQNIPVLEKITDNTSAQAIIGRFFGGYPVTYEVSQFLLNFYRFISNQWSEGKRLTDPYYLGGVDTINPLRTISYYTKPILLLVNELDFSGGDFFPAIMQDNKRAVIMGARTSGAGGVVRDIQVPNDLGIDRIRITASIAKRLDDHPIENLGVTPDVPYQITTDDLTGGYRGYAAAIQATMDRMTGAAPANPSSSTPRP